MKAPEKLLLVDDEESIRTVLKITLEDAGYEVSTAENGTDALRVFRLENPDIVLTDIKMPGISGVELLARIKSESPETEVIMITGHGDMRIAIESLKKEATDFITKPIDDDALEIALKRAKERILMRRQLREYTENLEALVKEKSARLVEAERVAAVSKAFEGMASAIWDLAGDMDGGMGYLNTLPCLVSVHNRDLGIVASNQLFNEYFGDKTGGQSWEIYKSDRESCPVGKTFRSGAGMRTRETVERLNGLATPVIVHTAPIKNTAGDVELVIEISADITELKRLQAELESTRKNYEQLFNEVPCYITVQDRDFNLVAANRRFAEDFDTESGTHCYTVYKHRGEPCADCPVARTFEDGKIHETEMVVAAKTGEQYNVLIQTAPIRNAAGEITRVMEMSTNITQIRRLQDHLASLGLQIGTISHSIKGLLTGLDGGMYILDAGFKKENRTQIEEGWDIVKMMIGQVRKLVLDILYSTKERDLELERVDASEFASDIADIIEPKSLVQNIAFIRDIDSGAGIFEADRGMVRSALVNILENALDACAEDRKPEQKRIVFKMARDRNRIIFEIAENGIGMDAETIENLFTLFYSSKGVRGTGLGLSISRNIVKQHGGEIGVESEKGQGSRFRIVLPEKVPTGEMD